MLFYCIIYDNSRLILDNLRLRKQLYNYNHNELMIFFYLEFLIKNKTKLEDNNYQELQEFENWLAPLSIIKQKFSNYSSKALINSS